jgi:hypothetical protein
MVKLIKHERGPRLYLIGKRVHHGSVGVGLTLTVLLAASKQRRLRPLALLGLAMIAHDIKDFPWTDNCNH